MTNLHRLFWRVHFWAGLVIAPIVVFATLTGLLYVFTPLIEASMHGRLDWVPAGERVLPLDVQVSAVKAAFPSQAVRSVVPAQAAGNTTLVILRAPEGGHVYGKRSNEHDHGLPNGTIVYVDPYTASIVGHLGEMQRFKTWTAKLHSSLLQGNAWRWPLELAASWMLVMFGTGAAMWWPRPAAEGGPGWRALLPRLGRGRQTWRDLHALVALALGLVLAAVMVTGLTWSRHAGSNFRWVQDGLGQSSRPARPPQSTPIDGAPPLTWQGAMDHALVRAPDIRLQLTPPRGAKDTWRVENFDRSQPRKRFTLLLDAYTGGTLFFSDWGRLPVVAKAIAVGIPFHRGELGAWNQALLVLAALAALFSVVSSLVMWWQRRSRGRLTAPSLERRHLRRVPRWIWVLAVSLSIALPVFGLSLLLFASLEAVRMLHDRGRHDRGAVAS